MSKTVLVTRARGDESELTDALHERGFNVIHEPLTEIFLLHTARMELQHALEENPNAVLITSRHGARALATLTPIRDLSVLCVGDSTLEVAQSLGFDRSLATGRNIDDMIQHLASAYDEDAKFVYASADYVRADMETALAPHGMQCRRIVVYEAKPVESLSEILTEHVKHGHIDAVTFLSGRSAEVFSEHTHTAGLEKALGKMHACCMSEAVASQLKKGWKKVHNAAEPTLASLAQCVDNALA